MWKLYVVVVFFVCLVVVSLVVTWKAFISKPKQTKGNDFAPNLEERLGIREVVIRHLKWLRPGQLMTEDTPITQLEVWLGILAVAGDKKWAPEVRDGILSCVFENGHKFVCDDNSHIKTVHDLIVMLEEQHTASQ